MSIGSHERLKAARKSCSEARKSCSATRKSCSATRKRRSETRKRLHETRESRRPGPSARPAKPKKGSKDDSTKERARVPAGVVERTMRFVWLGLTAAMFTSACTVTSPACATTCSGCCDARGACQLGSEAIACGLLGGACQTCDANKTCFSGTCVGGTGGGGETSDGGTTGPACAGTLLRCDATCIDPLADENNCGRCGKVCSNGMVCNQGTCELLPSNCSTTKCPPGYGCDPATLKCVTGCRVANDCPSGATCTAGACTCATGFHQCGQSCVSDANTGSCGARCESCPVANLSTATCSAGQCGHLCVAGAHDCGGVCVSDNDVNTCGSRCAACPTPSSGTAICASGVCSASCAGGQHLCGSSCADDSAAATCGARCTPCPVPSHGASTCTNKTCGVACDTGYHACGDSCASDTDATKCGSQCTNCPGGANGTPACQAAACTVSCTSGFHLCAGACKPDGDSANCGPSCSVCPAGPAHSTPACAAGSCDFTCDANYSRCGTSCCFAFARIEAGANRTCGLTTGGGMKCWGLGTSGITASKVPTDVTGFTSGVVDFSVGSDSLCAVMSSGEVHCVGNNTYAVCGGSAQSYSSPHTVAGVAGATGISSGDRETCVVTSTGDVYCWGQPYEITALGGVPTAFGAPVHVGLSNVVEVSVYTGPNSHACARLSDKSLWCWGANGYGQGGVSATSTASATPIKATAVTSVSQVVTGYDSTCVIDSGALKCFGYTYDSSARLWSVNGTTGVKAIGRTPSFGGCIALTNGTAKCWGDNSTGRIGDGTTTPSTTLVTVSGLTNVSNITTLGVRSCAVTSGGVGYCWGQNTSGELGDGTTGQSLTPIEVKRP